MLLGEFRLTPALGVGINSLFFNTSHQRRRALSQMTQVGPWKVNI